MHKKFAARGVILLRGVVAGLRDTCARSVVDYRREEKKKFNSLFEREWSRVISTFRMTDIAIRNVIMWKFSLT